MWTLAWLLGTAAICWVAVTQFAPRVEDRLLSGIQTVLAPLTSTTPIIASVHGREATLTGRVSNNQQRANLLFAVEGVPGVRSVVDQLTLQEPTSPTENDNNSDTTRDAATTESAEDAKTLTVIDSSSSESSSESSIQLNDDLPSKSDKVSNVTATTEDTETDTDAVATDTDVEADTDAISDTDTSEEPWPPEPEAAENTNDNQSIATVESNGQSSFIRAEPESTSLYTPALDFNIAGKTLAISGRLSDKDDAAPLIRTAMAAFDLDYISNTIELSDEVGNATWLSSVSTFLPDMAGLENPSIEINDNRIELGGNAPDKDTQDAVLAAAASLLGDYTMSEEIVLADASLPTANESATNTDDSDTNASIDAVTKAEAQNDVVANDDATPGTESEIESDNINASAGSESVDAASDNDTPKGDASNVVSETEAVDTPLTSEDSDAISESSDPATDEAESLPPITSINALNNALNDLPSMDIRFESSSDILTFDSLDVLDSIANVLVAHPDIPVRIEGHTDASGAKQDNLILSQLRANSVRDYLIDRGVSIYRLKAYGFGEGVPISDNSTPDGRADNRRIEFNFQR